MTSFTDYLLFWSAGLLVLLGLVCALAFVAGLVWFYRQAVEAAEVERDNERYRKWQEDNREAYSFGRTCTATDEDTQC